MKNIWHLITGLTAFCLAWHPVASSEANTQVTPPICPVNRFGVPMCGPGSYQPGDPVSPPPTPSVPNAAQPLPSGMADRATRNAETAKRLEVYCAVQQASGQPVSGGLCQVSGQER